MNDETLGQIVDKLGCSAANIGEDRMITDVIVLAKTVRLEDGDVTLHISNSGGISWMEKVGILQVANRLLESDFSEVYDDEDDE